MQSHTIRKFFYKQSPTIPSERHPNVSKLTLPLHWGGSSPKSSSFKTNFLQLSYFVIKLVRPISLITVLPKKLIWIDVFPSISSFPSLLYIVYIGSDILKGVEKECNGMESN